MAAVTPVDALRQLVTLDALAGREVLPLIRVARLAINAQLDQLETIRECPEWGGQAHRRLSAFARNRPLFGDWFVPVRPHPESRAFKMKAILVYRPLRAEVGAVYHREAPAAFAALWQALYEKSPARRLGGRLPSPKVHAAAQLFVDLQAAVRASWDWLRFDEAHSDLLIRRLGA